MKSQEPQTLNFMYLKQKEAGGELQEEPPWCLQGEQDVFRICCTERDTQSSGKWELTGWKSVFLWCHRWWWHSQGSTGTEPPPICTEVMGTARNPETPEKSINPPPELSLQRCSPRDMNLWCQNTCVISESSEPPGKGLEHLLLWTDNNRNPEHQCPHFHLLTKLLSQVKNWLFNYYYY